MNKVKVQTERNYMKDVKEHLHEYSEREVRMLLACTKGEEYKLLLMRLREIESKKELEEYNERELEAQKRGKQ